MTVEVADPERIRLPEWFEQSPLQAQWTGFLLRFPMQWFCTMTFRERVHPEAADRAWRLWSSKLNREVYGHRWWRDPEKGVYWIRALEWQKRQVIHYHALVGAEHPMDELADRFDWMGAWHKGFARIYTIESDELVRRYVSKYVTKDGEIDLSLTLDDWWQRQRQLLLLPGPVTR